MISDKIFLDDVVEIALKIDNPVIQIGVFKVSMYPYE